MSNRNLNLENLLENMWTNYCELIPQAKSIYDKLNQVGEIVVNDHIALRTLKHPKTNIYQLSKHFEKYGYFEAGEYKFENKKLFAKHWQHPNLNYPKVFISELEIEKLTETSQIILNKIIDQISAEAFMDENILFKGSLWKISSQDYLSLAQESEYASWFSAWGFRPNHFTVSINHLNNYKDIYKLNNWLKELGYKLNSSGGEVKGTPEELLEQSSTMADEQWVQFQDKNILIPSCYYEFAKRYSDESGKLYHGFIAKSADKIFESTNRS